MGSDGGGSIRIPASFCSVVGLKPTHGRLSFMPNPNHSSTCAVKGPIATDVRSLAAVYAVVSRPHPKSPFHTSSLAMQALLRDAERPTVIGVPEAWLQHAAPGVQKLCRAVIKRLASSKNYKVVPIEIPFVEEGRIAHAMTMLTDAATVLPDTRGISPAIRIMLALGRTTPSTDFLLAQKLRRVLMQHLAWLWEKHPGMVIVTPTSGCAGWPIRTSSELKHGINDGNRTQETMEYVWMANFCGVPSITLPVGYVVPEGQPAEGDDAGPDTVGKIPVGLMATGEWASEASLLQFGLDVEDLCIETQCRPPTWVDVVELAKNGTEDISIIKS
jgi:Asp-tRNA(Asn)/Glu-tRNA(Gln) amidotransferase A subunit family amidase